jgi:hypothetical protein
MIQAHGLKSGKCRKKEALPSSRRKKWREKWKSIFDGALPKIHHYYMIGHLSLY